MKLKSYLLLATIILSVAIGFFPQKIFAAGGGCYDNDRAVYVSQPTGNPTVNNGCPLGSSLVGKDGTTGKLVGDNLKYTPLEPFPGQTSGATNFCQLIDLIFKFLIYLGAMLAVLFLVLSGITYMVSEVVDKRSAARNRIKAAVWGLIILLASWIILNTINPQLINACSILKPTESFGVVSDGTPSQPTAVALREACQKVGSIQTGTVSALKAKWGWQIIGFIPTPSVLPTIIDIPATCGELNSRLRVPINIKCTDITPGEVCLSPK